MPSEFPLLVYVYKDIILIKNKDGKTKKFPRCDITNINSFLMEMVKIGKLDDLLF